MVVTGGLDKSDLGGGWGQQPGGDWPGVKVAAKTTNPTCRKGLIQWAYGAQTLNILQRGLRPDQRLGAKPRAFSVSCLIRLLCMPRAASEFMLMM